MGCKMIAAITWTLLELEGLLEDKESHVHFERVKKHLGLHPFHLTDLNAGLREILTSGVNSYDSKLKGIVLSYKNPKLLSRVGTLLYDTCYIHIDIEADFYIFRPNVGDTLKGIVNKKSQDHVGILVHKTFNVTIPRPDDDENWPGHSIHIGQEVRFTITLLDFKDRLPYIRGSLDEEDYLRGCQTFDETIVATNILDIKSKKLSFLYNEDGELNDSSTNQVEDRNTKQKVSPKKSKKLKTENIDDGIHVKNKRKLEVEVSFSEEDADSHERNQNYVGSDSNIDEEFLPGKLKLKREIIDSKIHTKKRNNKSKVEDAAEADYEVFESSKKHVKEVDVSDEALGPKKAKKLKKEKKDSKNKSKTKLEVEITHSDADTDTYTANGNKNTINELEDKRIAKQHKIKTEILSETDSDVYKKKKIKRIKIETDDEHTTKKHKVKSEILSSETDTKPNEFKQSKKKRRIKTEVLALESESD